MHRTCDGMRRRDLLRAGVIATGTLPFAGLPSGNLGLDGFLRMADAGELKSARADRAIFIELPGGPSHMDTFDLKPNAPAKVRGKFNPIKTNVPGIEICEHLPKLAAVADKFAILRGVSHTLAAHQLGQEYVNTGSRPVPSLEYPSFGSVMGKERPTDPDLPNQVAIPRAAQGAGFLGIAHAPLETNATPVAGKRFAVRGLSLVGGITVDEVRRRQSLLNKLDRRFANVQSSDALLEGLDQFGMRAYDMITSARAREAFDISREPESFAKPFGDSAFGQSCLLALRLVESGVRLASVQYGGWDTHTDNFTRLQERLPAFDEGLSALFAGLEMRGLLESTAVYVTGEFGRTPKINDRSTEGGRDHYPRCMFMLMAGGGVRGGQVIGESDDTAAGPRHEAIKPDDVAASFYANLGIDPKSEYQTSTGRPITLVRDGEVIPELFA
ncbi:DUF1501 domain-containing protein [Rubripirellula amarantea]|nr:DUF1501 domain-containing protein [Rubripirellula amarantea]